MKKVLYLEAAKMKKRWFLVAAFLIGAVLSFGTPILNLQTCDQVNAALDGVLVSPRVGGITFSLNGETYGDSTAAHNVGPDAVWAGIYRADIYDLSGHVIVDNYPSLCMSVTTNPVIGSPQIHVVTDNVPSDLEHIWATYHDAAVGNAPQAAALQLAAWEILYEDVATNGYDLASGDFFLAALNTASPNNNGANFDDLITQANTYLNASTWTAEADLMSLYRDGYQPLVIEVPEPATLLLLLVGLTGCLTRNRRRNGACRV